jgi:hypothetical protein
MHEGYCKEVGTNLKSEILKAGYCEYLGNQCVDGKVILK